MKLFALFCGLAVLFVGLMLALAGPRGDSTVDLPAAAAVFPPWWDADRTLTAAAATGDSVVRSGGIDSVIVVAAERPGLAARLRAAGAWLVLDPRVVGGCSIVLSGKVSS